MPRVEVDRLRVVGLSRQEADAFARALPGALREAWNGPAQPAAAPAPRDGPGAARTAAAAVRRAAGGRHGQG